MLSKRDLFRSVALAALSLIIGAAKGPAAFAQVTPAITEHEAHAIGVDAYIYLYPLLSMDISRKQFTNIEPGKEFGKGPMNTFVNVPAYPPADFKGVVRSNFDTLYSIVWLDLTKEPMVVSAPDTGGRYFSSRCSTCGPMCLHRRVGARQELRRPTIL